MTVHSDIGKLISFFCSVWGAFNISIIVVLLHNTFSLNHQERQSLATMKNITKTLDKR